ncbi:hypothetical protein ACFWFX_27135 [Streptomyces roseolus]|uniref:hypothetical protein n=1 Tax=Streptomyces roseolus TaxID=67358 RepID=UPI003652C79B
MITVEDGDEYAITPEAWEIYSRYRDKAYREAAVIAEMEAAIRRQVAREYEERARQVRTDVGAQVRPGEGWAPIGYGLEAKAVLTDPAGTYWLRPVTGDVLRDGANVYEVIQTDLLDVDADYYCYTVWVSRPAGEDE